MDRAVLQQRLAKTVEQIASRQRHIAEQREIIAELERNGRPTDYAKYLLAGLELLQAAHQNYRHQLLKALSKNSKWALDE
jgi:hypothetical protein